MALYEADVSKLLGADVYELLQKGVDTGPINKKRAGLIAKELPDDRIYGQFSQISVRYGPLLSSAKDND